MNSTITIRRVTPTKLTQTRTVPEMISRVIEEVTAKHLDSMGTDGQNDRCGTLIKPLIRGVAGETMLGLMTQHVLQYLGIDDDDALGVARRTDGELIRRLQSIHVGDDLMQAVYGVTWSWTCELLVKVAGLPDWAIFRLLTGQRQMQNAIYVHVFAASTQAVVAELRTALEDRPPAIDDLVERATRRIYVRAYGDAGMAEEKQDRHEWLGVAVATAVADKMCDFSEAASYCASFAMNLAQLKP